MSEITLINTVEYIKITYPSKYPKQTSRKTLSGPTYFDAKIVFVVGFTLIETAHRKSRSIRYISVVS